ncbi:MAG: DUF2075 domain-containing protein, partial [Chloroflexi bacterium]|nr:DUF2075 domain-containing protein [Chloroflexota bacterium]
MRVLQTALPQLLAHRSDAASWTIVFEYELPRERGHRPDVVILTGTAILVLEFKQLREAHRAHIDQVAAYARDLHAYHAGSHAHPVIPLLVPTSSPSPPGKSGPVYVVGPGSLARALAVLGAEGVSRPPLDPQQWLDSGYAPLPTLVEAAQTIFAHEPLPTIRRARSAGIPEVVDLLRRIALYARDRHQRHLIFVMGVPGSGKTLAGLQLVHDHTLVPGRRNEAVYLSRNTPLVTVLQHQLRSTLFVQGMHGFLKEYGGHSTRLPREHVWVYDEGQRALDAPRVQQRRDVAVSEPEDFIRLGDRMAGWACV